MGLTQASQIDPKPMSSEDFLDGLKKSNSVHPETNNTRSFADLAKAQKQQEDEDLFNNLMEGDGKQDSSRMVLNEQSEQMSQTKSGSHLGFNSAHQNSRRENQKFTEPLQSPVF